MEEIEIKVAGQRLYRVVVPRSRAQYLFEALREIKEKEDMRRTVKLTRKLFPWLFDPFADPPEGFGTDPIDPVEMAFSRSVEDDAALVTVDGRTMALEQAAGEWLDD